MGLPANVLGPSARAHYEARKAASAAAPPTAAARQLVSARIKAAKRGEKVSAEEFRNMCQRGNVPEPVTEFVFHPIRKWRFDYAWPAFKIALEVDGGSFIQGRHNRGGGFRDDIEKANAAVCLGWGILRALPEQLLKADTVEMVKRAMRAKLAGFSPATGAPPPLKSGISTGGATDCPTGHLRTKHDAPGNRMDGVPQPAPPPPPRPTAGRPPPRKI
jgi:hypothetical protein